MIQSFSRKGCPYDNACIESLHATLKKEEVYQTTYVTFKQARITLFQYIGAGTIEKECMDRLII